MVYQPDTDHPCMYVHLFFLRNLKRQNFLYKIYTYSSPFYYIYLYAYESYSTNLPVKNQAYNFLVFCSFSPAKFL